MKNFENYKFKKLESQLNNLKKNKHYEISRDNIFLNEAINNLTKNPFRYLNLFFKKNFFILFY